MSDDRKLAQISGVMHKVEYSAEDAISIHDAHDIDMFITPDAESVPLVLDAVPTDRQVLETESLHFPAEVRPLPDDHVTAIGHHIYDCGHEPKTEIHGLSAFETDRIEQRFVLANVQPVRVAHVMLNSHSGPDNAAAGPGYFNADLNGPFSFNLGLPTSKREDKPYIAVLSGDPAAVTARLSGSHVVVTVNPPASAGTFLWTLAVGFSGVRPMQQGRPSVGDMAGYAPYNITLDAITISHDHDDALPSDCVLVHNCGEWFMDVNVNGTAVQIFENSSICDCDANGGPQYGLGISFPIVANRDAEVQLHVNGYESDDREPHPGVNIGGCANGDFNLIVDANCSSGITQSGEAIWDLGKIAELAGTGQRQFQPPGNDPDYVITYHVDGSNAGSTIMQDQSFWMGALVDEPNDGPKSVTGLGSIRVPDLGEIGASVKHSSSIAEYPLTRGGSQNTACSTAALPCVTLLGADVDRYRFALTDFADVKIEPLPAGLQTVLGFDDAGCKQEFGGTQANLRIASGTGERGLVPYLLSLLVSAKVLPPDWGVLSDTPTAGRPVDLRSPDPATVLGARRRGTPATRMLAKPCAWQHLPDEVHYYHVTLPTSEAKRPEGPACKYDRPSGLRLTAIGMQITDQGSGNTGDGQLSFSDISDELPSREVIVKVSGNGSRRRSTYQFEALWNDALYYTPQECMIETNTAAVVNPPKFGPPTMQGIIDQITDLITDPNRPREGLRDATGRGLVLPEAGLSKTVRVGASIFDTFILTASTSPTVTARLYDKSGVLVAQSSSDKPVTAASLYTNGPAGLNVVSRITATGLAVGSEYTLSLTWADRSQSRESGADLRVALRPVRSSSR